MKKPSSVDEYIADAPEEIREKLGKLRSLITNAAPKAEEKISYGMPYYSYKGRLAYFRLAKNHIGLYVLPPIVQNFKKELKSYQTGEAAIQFPLDQDLPENLITTLIKARVKINESHDNKKG